MVNINRNNRRLEQIISEELNIGIDSPTSVNVFVKKESSPKLDRQFIFVFQDFVMIAASYQFKYKASYQLLIAIMGYVDYGNYFSIDISDIAELTNNSKRSVLRAINELKELNILIPVENRNDKRRNDYSINPNAIWKGKSEDRKLVMDKPEFKEVPNLFSNIGDILSINR
jgi:hypothetical protein